MPRLFAYALLAAIICVTTGGIAHARPVYTIGMWSPDESSNAPEEMKIFLTEAYNRAGADVEFRYLPMLRELDSVNKGTLDGSAARTKQAIARFPNLRRVPTPLLKATISAFTYKDIDLNNKSDLTGLALAFARGEIASGDLAKSLSSHVFEVDNHKQLVAVVRKGRVDAGICNTSFEASDMERNSLEGIRISEPLVSHYLYHALNKNIGDAFIKRLDDSFREMIRDGTLKRIIGDYAPMEVDGVIEER